MDKQVGRATLGGDSDDPSKLLPSLDPNASSPVAVIMSNPADTHRNLGSFPDDTPNVATGVVGAPECGDVMKLQLKINDAGIIEDACFKSFGCSNSMVSASLLTEYVKGRSVVEALQVPNPPTGEETCLLPVRAQCSNMVEDALKAAIEDWKKQKQRKGNHGD